MTFLLYFLIGYRVGRRLLTHELCLQILLSPAFFFWLTAASNYDLWLDFWPHFWSQISDFSPPTYGYVDLQPLTPPFTWLLIWDSRGVTSNSTFYLSFDLLPPISYLRSLTFDLWPPIFNLRSLTSDLWPLILDFWPTFAPTCDLWLNFSPDFWPLILDPRPLTFDLSTDFWPEHWPDLRPDFWLLASALQPLTNGHVGFQPFIQSLIY